MAGIPIAGTNRVVSSLAWRGGLPAADCNASSGLVTLLFQPPRVPLTPTGGSVSAVTYTLSKRSPFGSWGAHTQFSQVNSSNAVSMTITGLTQKTSYYFRVTASITITKPDSSPETQTITSQASNLITTAGPGNNPAGKTFNKPAADAFSVPTDPYQIVAPQIPGVNRTSGYDTQQFGIVGDSISTLNSLTESNVKNALQVQMQQNSSWFSQSEGLCKKIYTNTLLSGVAGKADNQTTLLDSLVEGLQQFVEDVVRLLTCRPETSGEGSVSPKGAFYTTDSITARIGTILNPPGNSDLVKDLQALSESLNQGVGDFLVDVWSGVEIFFDWLCTALTCGQNQTMSSVGPRSNGQPISGQQFSIPLTPSDSKPYTKRRLFNFVSGTQSTVNAVVANPLVSGLNTWATSKGSASLQPVDVGPNIFLNFLNAMMTGVQAICYSLTSGSLPETWQANPNFSSLDVGTTIGNLNSVNALLCSNPLTSNFKNITTTPSNSPLNVRLDAGIGGAAFYNGVAGVLSFSDTLSKLFGISGTGGAGVYSPTAGEVQSWLQNSIGWLSGGATTAAGTLQGALDIFQNLVECAWQIFVATPYSATAPTAAPNPNGRTVFRKSNDLNGSTQYWKWNGTSWVSQTLEQLNITTKTLQDDIFFQFLEPLGNFLNPGGNSQPNNFGDALQEIITFVECVAVTLGWDDDTDGTNKNLNWVIEQLNTVGTQFNSLIGTGQNLAWQTILGFFQFAVNGIWDILNVLYTFGTTLSLPGPRVGDKNVQDVIDIFYDWVGTVPIIGPLVQMITGKGIDQADPDRVNELGPLGWGLEQVFNFFTGTNNGGTLVDAVKAEVESILNPQKTIVNADGSTSTVPVSTGEFIQQILTKENFEYAVKDLWASTLANFPVSHLNSAEKVNLLTRGGFVTKSTILNGGGWSCDTGTNLSDYAGGSARHDIISGRSQKLYNNQTILVQPGDRISMSAQTKTTANYNGDSGSLRMGLVPFTRSGTGYTALAEVTMAARGGTNMLVQTISSESVALGGQPNVTPTYTVPSGVVAVKAFIQVGTSPTVGTVWWDSVSLWKAGGLEQENVVRLTGVDGAWSQLWDGLFGTTGSNKTVADIKPAAAGVAQASGTANANGQTAMVIGQSTVNSIDATFGAGSGTNASPANTLSQFQQFMLRLYGQTTPKTQLADTHIPGLQASKVTSGTFDDGRIPGLNANKVTSGTFDDVRIPGLQASKVTSGTFDDVRIPGLNANKIISGTFDDVRIPGLNANKIINGQFDDGRIPNLGQDKINNLGTDLNNRVDFTTYGSYLAGGSNICSNPGFEDPSGYLLNGTYETNSSTVYSGSRCARLAGTGSTRSIELISNKTSVVYAAASPLETYYVEFNVRGDNANTATGTANTIGVVFPVYTAANAAIGGTVGLFTNADAVGKNSWVTVKGYVTLGATVTIAKMTPRIQISGVAANSPNVYYFDDIVIREVTDSIGIKKKIFDSTDPQDQILATAVPGLDPSKISGSGQFNVNQIPDLNANKITTGTIPPQRLPSGVGAVGSGVALARTTGSFTTQLGSNFIPSGFYDTSTSTSDITIFNSGSGFPTRLQALNPGWYLVEINYTLRNGGFTFGWELAPVVYKLAAGITTVSSPGLPWKYGHSTIFYHNAAFSTTSWGGSFAGSSFIVYLNANESIVPGYYWSNYGNSTASGNVIQPSPTGGSTTQGLGTYCSMSLINRSLN